MTQRNVPYRRPSADEQTVLRQMQVKLLVRPKDNKACDQILVEHHYATVSVPELLKHLDAAIAQMPPFET
jgi:hypothetical protein